MGLISANRPRLEELVVFVLGRSGVPIIRVSFGWSHCLFLFSDWCKWSLASVSLVFGQEVFFKGFSRSTIQLILSDNRIDNFFCRRFGQFNVLRFFKNHMLHFLHNFWFDFNFFDGGHYNFVFGC